METLDDLIKGQRDLKADEVLDDALPEIQSSAEQRVVWNINFEDGHLSLDALLQQRKKRGDGFTKGKKLSLEKVCADFGLPLSPVDKRIVTHITSESSYYHGRKSYSLDLFGALGELVGQSNVMFGGEPCDVRRRPLVLTLAKAATEDCWRFRLTDELGDSSIAWSWPDTTRRLRLIVSGDDWRFRRRLSRESSWPGNCCRWERSKMINWPTWSRKFVPCKSGSRFVCPQNLAASCWLRMHR